MREWDTRAALTISSKVCERTAATADPLMAAVDEVKRILGRRASLRGLGVATRPEDRLTDGDASDA
jgi:hypothetical protein